MSFLRIKTINKKGRSYKYLYRQTNVRKKKRVHSIMEYICAIGWIAVAAASPGKPGGFSGNRPTDKRQIRDQERADRELFVRDRAMFNAKVRMDYAHEQKARNAAKEKRDGKLSREERQQRTEAKEAADKKFADNMAAAQEFNEARTADKATES